MTVTVRPGRPNAAASSFFSGIIREPLAGIEAICPVSADVSHPVSSPTRTVEGLIAVFEASREAFGGRTALNLPALNVRVQDMLDALGQVAGSAVRELVRFQRDERIAGIVANWPSGASAERAAKLGLGAACELCRDHPPVHRRLPQGAERERDLEGHDPMSTQIDLKDRVAVITGAAQGIGYATAERMLRSGASVALWDIDAARLNDAETALGKLGKVSASIVELSLQPDVQAATADALKAHGRIDILVNNAGITGGNAVTWELDPAVWRKVVEVNLIAPFLTCHAIVPQMLKQGYGRIVNIASIAGKEGNPNASHYSASKAG
jgi:nucleoside-diphosphate-sugar epimerase